MKISSNYFPYFIWWEGNCWSGSCLGDLVEAQEVQRLCLSSAHRTASWTRLRHLVITGWPSRIFSGVEGRIEVGITMRVSQIKSPQPGNVKSCCFSQNDRNLGLRFSINILLVLPPPTPSRKSSFVAPGSKFFPLTLHRFKLVRILQYPLLCFNFVLMEAPNQFGLLANLEFSIELFPKNYKKMYVYFSLFALPRKF